jgi:hypothetical protein
MLDRDQTIERLKKIRDGIRVTLNLNDDDANLAREIENIDVELDAILIELTADDRAGIALLIELRHGPDVLALPLFAQYPGSLCAKCSGCDDHECRCPAAMKCVCN